MVELVVVILVMALLAAVGIVAFNQVSSNARIAAAKAELTTVAKAAVAELTLREASAFDAVWVTPLYGEVIAAVDAGETAAGGFTPLGPDTPLTSAGQYGLAFKDLTGQVNATQGVGVTFATWVDGTVVSVSASAAGTIADNEGENASAWAGDALNTAVQERVNLATNPSFETVGGTVVVRENLCVDPKVTGVKVSGVSRWTVGSGSASSPDVLTPTGRIMDNSGGTVPYRRDEWIALAENRTYTFSIRVASGNPADASFTAWTPTWEGVANKKYGVDPSDPNRRWLTFTTTTAGKYIFGIGALAGRVVEVGQVLVEASTAFQPYFDGSTPPAFTPAPGEDTSGYPVFNGQPVDPDLTPAWSGEVNASTSVLRGKRVAGVSTIGVDYNRAAISSTRWPHGGHSVRIIRTNNEVSNAAGYILANDDLEVSQLQGRKRRAHVTAWTPGPTGSLDWAAIQHEQAVDVKSSRSDGGTSKAALPGGEVEFWSTYTIRPDATYRAIYLPASTVVGESVWWDHFVAEDITDSVPADTSYFDGATPGTARTRYQWAGAPHASKSVALAW